MAKRKQQQPTKPKIATSVVYIPKGVKGAPTVTPEMMRKMTSAGTRTGTGTGNQKRKRRR